MKCELRDNKNRFKEHGVKGDKASLKIMGTPYRLGDKAACFPRQAGQPGRLGDAFETMLKNVGSILVFNISLR